MPVTREEALENVRKYVGAASFVPVEEMRTMPGFIPSSRRPRAVTLATFMIPAYALVAGVTVGKQLTVPGFWGPSWVVWVILVGSGLFFPGMSWWLATATTSYGIATSNAGVAVFTRPFRGPNAISRTIRWEDIQAPKRATKTTILMEGDPIIATELSREQARAIFWDARYPDRERIPAEVTAVVGAGPRPQTRRDD